MEFRILGPLEVLEAGREVVVSGARERALLAILLIHAGEVVSADRLIDQLWGSDLPANPANALQVVVSRVRKALEVPEAGERQRLATRRPGYVLELDAEELDARRFGRLVGQARQAAADQRRRSSLLGEALGLWRGPALADFVLEDFAAEEIARLDEARVAAVGISDGASLGVGGEAARPLADKLIDYLREKELLAVLDNCEHLIEACAQVAARVLRSAPGVRLLATSRERLGVDGEVLLPVPPLGVPGDQDISSERLAHYDSVRLFLDRASAVRSSFVLDAGTAPAVSQICRRLDGIPLALELAAARVRILPASEIASRLDDRLSLLTSGNRTALPRHRTLQAAIDWSYELASGPERELFGQLSVFTGGFTLEAAEEVCGGDALVLELLSRLVDQSLVVPVDGGGARFRMLETLRGYAGQRLAESGTV